LRVTIQGISKVYKTKKGSIPVLEDINLIAQDQEFLCILGPSGCGKTTLLRIIANLLEPTSGKITLNGNKQQGNHDTALVFQEQGVFPWMNVLDNVCFGLEMQGMAKNERYNLALPLIDRLGLSDFITHYPHQLSVGMKQRAGVARAMVSTAEVLLMDEPFASLDAQMRMLSQEKLLEVCRDCRKTVIYVTHDIDESLLLADRIILLTARPARIKEEIKINISKPRNINGDSELLKMKQAIWEHLREEVNKVI
jgi:ABC-type nitrate/sulfonate/bicarbonate transport system ATPase subunit